MKRYVGLDVHKRTIAACLLDSEGKTVGRTTFDCTRTEIAKFAEEQLEGSDVVTLEATTNSWAVAEILEPYVERVVVSNPLKTKAIAEATVKTDTVDSHTLAQLLRAGFLPEVWHPSGPIQLLRQLTVFYASLINDRTRVKNRLQSLFHRRLIHCPVTVLFSKAGLQWMDSLEISEHDRLILELAKQQVFDLDAKIAELEHQIARLAKNNHSIKLLMTLPGVSLMSAACLVGVIGDVTRFRDGDHLAAYVGLVPRVKQSADHCYYGSITKIGNNQVRKMLVLAARNLRNHPGPLGAYFRRMAKRKHINVAATATARKLVTVAYLILKNGEPYRYAQPATTSQKFGQLHMLATQSKRAPVRIETRPDEPIPPTGYRLRRQPALDQVLIRDGLSPIQWQAVPKGEQMVIERFHDYIQGIRKPSATVHESKKTTS
jgi:transposase